MLYIKVNYSLGVIVLLGILEEAAGDVGLLTKLGAKVCQLVGGKDVSFLWCDDWVNAVKAAEGDKSNTNTEENTPAGTCDKTEADFKTWASTNVGTDNVTFNQTSCMGSVKNPAGDVIATYTWDGTAWK